MSLPRWLKRKVMSHSRLLHGGILSVYMSAYLAAALIALNSEHHLCVVYVAIALASGSHLVLFVAHCSWSTRRPKNRKGTRPRQALGQLSDHHAPVAQPQHPAIDHVPKHHP